MRRSSSLLPALLVALALGSGAPAPAAAAPRHAVAPADCVKHLNRVRESVQEYWSFLLMKTGAFDLEGMVARLRPEAEMVVSADQCADVLDRFMASLRDGHANLVYFPGRTPRTSPRGLTLRSFSGDLVRVGEEGSPGRVYVVRVDTAAAGVSPDLLGAELTRIDGVPTRTVLEHARARTSASTPWGLQHWADRRLLRGPAGSSVTLTLRLPGGELRDVVLERPEVPSEEKELKRAAKVYDDTVTLVTWKRLDDGVGYVRVTSFGLRRVVPEFDAALDSLRQTSGLIIDVRDNGGGYVYVLQDVLGRLLAKRTVVARLIVREPGSEYVIKGFDPWMAEKRKWTYTGPVVVLLDAGCFSACDLFASALEETGRARLVGTSPTGGGSASPAADFVSSGWNGARIRMSFVIATRADGSHIENNGIRPHHSVKPTVKDFVEGRDRVLEKGLEVLRSGEAKPLAQK